MSYTYDPDTRQYVADLLFRAVPAYFRTADESPEGRNELRQLLRILAAPLAIARQNIEELHADLFIDTADAWVLRYLAEMVGTTLIFPDADSNRRDIRSTIAFRRRKGTPAMLQELGETLTSQMVVTQEGWKLVQMTQDLNLLRRERLIPDIRPAILAETESGPLCATHHLVDIRAISPTTGIFHSEHVANWAHPTSLFPLEEGFPFDLRDPLTDPDFRFAFHPLGVFLPLRARRTSLSDRTIKTDRIPPMHFDQSPGLWFDRPGRFSVKIAGVAAALPTPFEQQRIVSNRVASPELADGTVSIRLLEHDPRRFRGPVRMEVAMVALAAGVPDTGNAVAIDIRARVEISASGASGFAVVNNVAIDPARVVMIRLQPVGAAAPHFPGCVVEIAGDTPGALLAVDEVEGSRQGFLRGALPVRIPATRVEADRWFFVSLDGSCFEAQTTGTGPADVAVTDLGGGVRTVPRERLLTQSPGPAWPPTAPSAEPDTLTRIPNAPGRGPLVLHGGRVLVPAGQGFADIGAGQSCALVFALRVGVVAPIYHPFLRLSWNGPDPAAGTWTMIGDAGAVAPLDARLGEIAALREDHVDEARLLVRFECQQADARFTPAEVAWCGYDGESTLIYMPALAAPGGANPIAAWPPGAGVVGISTAVGVAADGSTFDESMAANFRQSMGNIAPLAEYPSVQRRIVRQRRLCAWINENPPADMLAATPEGRLDIDVENGLFSLAGTEAIRPYPQGPEGPPMPPSLTVAYQDGYTDHTGAHPAAREPLLDARLETPTRIISGSGRLHSNAPSSWFAIPRYRTFGDALNDIAVAPQATEVIQFEDSATYLGETITWPAGVQRLVVQAAERERPVVIAAAAGWNVAVGASYDELVLLGIAWGADADGVFALPPAARYRVLYSSILRGGMTLRFDLIGSGEEDIVAVTRCMTAGLELVGAGELRITDSVVDAGHVPGSAALTASQGQVRLERSTVFGLVDCRVIDASETIFNDRVTVTDRFRGCVRYSRVTSDSVLPRIHRVVEDVALRFVSLDRHNPAHARLAVDADRLVLAGAEDGGEMGAFHEIQLALRYEGYRRRLEESTPAGLITGIIRLD
jgi:hypothetical protein